MAEAPPWVAWLVRELQLMGGAGRRHDSGALRLLLCDGIRSGAPSRAEPRQFVSTRRSGWYVGLLVELSGARRCQGGSRPHHRAGL